MVSTFWSLNPWQNKSKWCNGDCQWEEKNEQCVFKSWFKRRIYDNEVPKTMVKEALKLVSDLLILFVSVYPLILLGKFFSSGSSQSYRVSKGTSKCLSSQNRPLFPCFILFFFELPRALIQIELNVGKEGCFQIKGILGCIDGSL